MTDKMELIGHALTLVGILVGTLTVMAQLARQHRSSLLLQRDNAREALKVQLHEALIGKIRKLSSACVDVSIYALLIPFHISSHQARVARGIPPSPIKDRAQELSRLHFSIKAPLIELLEEFEAWSIAFPGFEVFNAALCSASHDSEKAFDPLYALLLTILPFDPPTEIAGVTGTLQRELSDAELAHLKSLVDRYREAVDEIVGYANDLAIESQNSLLSGLFERRVPLRKPIDPSGKVISTQPEKAKQLLHYFENESSWGKEKNVREAEVRASLAKPEDGN